MCERWQLSCGCGDSDIGGDGGCGGYDIGDRNGGGDDDGGGLYCVVTAGGGGGERGGVDGRGRSGGEPTYSLCVWAPIPLLARLVIKVCPFAGNMDMHVYTEEG